MGWFYDFKLHLICNEKGEQPSFMLTPDNVDDMDPLKNAGPFCLLFLPEEADDCFGQVSLSLYLQSIDFVLINFHRTRVKIIMKVTCLERYGFCRP